MGIFSSIFGDRKSEKRQVRAQQAATQAQVSAQQQAIDAQRAAQERAIEAQRAGFEEARGFIQPFQSAQPGSALNRARALTGALGPDAQRQAFQDFQESPGQEFIREQGLRGINAQAAATGGLGGGNRLKALIDFNQKLASTQFQNQLNNLIGIGQTDLGIAQGLGNLATGFGSQQAQGFQNIGQAQALGAQNIGAARAGGLQTAGQIQAQSRAGERQRLLSGLGGLALAPVTGGGSLIGSFFNRGDTA